MITPAGTECPNYYQDFHRGRSTQECRLIEKTPDGGVYSAELCQRCPVPRIVLANACKHMILEARATRGFFGLGRRVNVSAYCTRSHQDVNEPEIGCGQCHLDLPTFELPPNQE
jgi:hypothetical protein